MGSHTLLQGIFLTQGLNPCLISPALAGRFFTTSATKSWAPREEETEWGGEERRGEERGRSRASQFGERHGSLGKTNEKK